VKIACLPGDGIGPEVVEQALRVLRELPVDAEVVELPFGGAAIDATGEPLPAETLAACRDADAVLLGAVGGPRWEPGLAESGLLALRRELDVYANLRPAGDLLVVRELVGGLYFGARGVREDGTVFDTCEYHAAQVERVARRAFELASARRGSLVSVDKANVLDTSRLWRRVVTELARQYPDVETRHALVDSFAIEVALQPETLDVVLTENMFGDILSDLASGVLGGLGVAASASLGDAGPGIFEPIHGSAPDIAGTGAANPTAMLRSLALLLEHAAARADLARVVEGAVDSALATAPPRDVGGGATTAEFGDAVLRSLQVAVR
jgi:3-isopropylmalate dehydrogenase